MSLSYREHFAPRLLGKSRFISLLLSALVATLLGAAPAEAAPATPTITSLSGGNGYITVNFSGGSGATGFKYQLSTDDGVTWTSPAFVADVGGARDLTSPLTIFGMSNATYKVRLIASDGAGDSSPAEFASAVTSGPKTGYSGEGTSRNAFLMGTYAEVGVRANGAFGSSQTVPSGFHANPTSCLGFRVDRSFDGWGNSIDDGDFFCPGTPYEGWTIKVGASGTAFNQCHSPTSASVSNGPSGSLSEISSSDGIQSVKWQASTAVNSSSSSASEGIVVTQIARVPDSSQVLHVDIQLRNNSSSTLTNIYYGRSFDPDNQTSSDVFGSTNKILTRNSPAEVKSTWTNGSLISMKSTDTRANAARRSSAFGCIEDPQNIYDGTGSWTSSTSENYADAGTGIAVLVSSLGPNESTDFRISYVLSDNEANLPGAPTINSVTKGDGSLSVAFTGASNNPTNYDLSLDGGISWNTISPATTTSPISVTGLTNGTTYNIKLRGRNSYGTGPVSNTVSGTPSTTPSPPIIDSLAASENTITAYLTPGSDGGSVLTNYEYALSSDNSTWGSYTALSPPSTSRSFTVTGLTGGTTYYIRVRAINANGTSLASNVASLSTASAPGAPTIDSITPSNSSLSVEFSEGGSGGSPITNLEYSIDDGVTWESATATTSPLLITGLTNGTSYPIKLRFINGVGIGTASASEPGTPATVPGAPSFSGDVTPSSGSLTLTITPGNNGGSPITSYQYSTDRGSTWRNRGDGQTTSTTLTINTLSSDGSTALENGTEYCVQVRAVNNIGNGDASASTCATPVTTPSSPTINSIIARNTSLEVNFSYGSNGGSVVTTLEYSKDDGATWETATLLSSPLLIAGLTNGTTYPIKLRASNTAGVGSVSASQNGTPSTTPDAPVIDVVIPSNSRLTVEFTAGANGGSTITNYEYSVNGGVNWTTRGPTSTSSPLVISGLTNDTTYQVQIRAINANGSGASSGTSVASTPRLIADAPVIDSITGGNQSLSVAFTAGADNGSAITNYEFSVDNGATWLVRAPTATSSPISIVGLTNGTTYQVRLRAVNGAGVGAQSAVVTGIPFTTPAAPTISSISAGAGSLTVNFTPGSDGGNAVTNFQYSTNAGSTWTSFSPSITTSPATISGISAGTYSVKIRAINGAGTGLASNTVEATASSDSTAPTFVSAAVNATTLEMTYNEALSSTTAATSTFTVLVDGVARSVTAVSISSTKVVLTLASAVLYGQTVTVAYTDPSGSNDSNAIQDAAGNDAATLSATSVTNDGVGLPGLIPLFSSIAKTSGGFTFLVTNFDSSYTYTLSITGGAQARISNVGVVTVSGIEIDGSYATVTITTSKVGYLSTSSSIQGSSGIYIEPSVFITITGPKIRQTIEFIICDSGTYLFYRQSTFKEESKITNRKFYLMTEKDELAEVNTDQTQAKFEKNPEWKGIPLYCVEEIQQEGVVNISESIDTYKFTLEVRAERLVALELKRTYSAELLSIKKFRSVERTKLAQIKSRESKSNPTPAGLNRARESYRSAIRLLDEQVELLNYAAATRLEAGIDIARIKKEKELESAGQVIYFY